jgi:lipase
VEWVIEREAPGARVHLSGHSVGGVIAAGYAHRCPDRVASFVNVEGNFTLADAFSSRQRAANPPGEVRENAHARPLGAGALLRDAAIEPTDDRVGAAAEAAAFQPFEHVAGHGPRGRRLHRTRRLRDHAAGVFDRVPVHLVAGAGSPVGWDVAGWALEAAASHTEMCDAGQSGGARSS